MRKANIKRKTKETDVEISILIDGRGKYSIATPVPFLNHMLELFSYHSNFDLVINADGDVNVDYHHIVEDIGIVLGKAFSEALGNKEGIKRYGSISIPMDETLVSCYVDISGRPNLVYKAERKGMIKDFDISLVETFFQAFATNASLTLHIVLNYGKNAHHISEAIFKSVARALKEAVEVCSNKGVPSTKGIILTLYKM